MLYNPPTGSIDPNAPYVGYDPVSGAAGSKVPRLAVEATQREIVAAIAAAGLSPSNADLTQLLQAIRILAGRAAPPESLWHAGTATGSPSALSVTLSPGITAYPPYLAAVVTMPFANADNATIAPNGLPAVPILRNDGSPIRNGDMPAGCDALLGIRNGQARLIGFGRAETPVIAPSGIQFYVRTDGNDGNSGLVNSPDGAFRTIAGAALAAGRYLVPNSYPVLQLGIPGTYDGPNFLPQLGNGFAIYGDVNNPSLYAISGAGGPSISPVNAAGVRLILRGVTLVNTGTTSHTALASVGGTVDAKYVTFLATNASNTNAHAAAFAGGQVLIGDGCRFGSSFGGMLFADGGDIVISGAIGLVNAPAWSGAAATAIAGGRITNVGATFNGSGATGRRGYVDSNGVIRSNGGGANFFPGDAPVLVVPNSGGYYA